MIDCDRFQRARSVVRGSKLFVDCDRLESVRLCVVGAQVVGGADDGVWWV